MEQKKITKEAYGGIHGSKYESYVKKDHGLKEVTPTVIAIGILLALLFSASNAYSAITAGITVAAGIPGAILGGGLLAIFIKKNNALNTNIVQGMASSGESIASGMTFVLPAIFLAGQSVGFLQGTLVGVGGALLGIAVASLVHNYLIIEEHGNLIYPEAMAISETVASSDAGGDGLKTMGIGFGIGSFFVLISNQITGLVSTSFGISSSGNYKWQWSTDANPLLLGIGFIVGMEIAATMLAGTILANFVLIPLIGYFTTAVDPTMAAWNDPSLLVSQMTAGDIQGTYTKYIGAGMMLSGGIIGAIKLIPVIVNSIKETLSASKGEGESNSGITGLLFVVAMLLIVVSSVFIATGISMMLVAFILILIFSFLFSIVAARMTGTIGTSNLPVSGMTIASLLIVTVTFVVIGSITGSSIWTDTNAQITILLALTTVVTAIAISGGYAQTQKATFIIGGSKNNVQKTYVLGSIFGVIAAVGAIILLASIYTVNDGMAPQANLMADITTGILTGNLPWVIIGVGILLAIVFFILDLPIMTIAIGLYLPVGTVSIIFFGALIKVIVQKVNKDEEQLEAKQEKGVIFSSGLIAGGAILGLIGAFLAVISPDKNIMNNPLYLGGEGVLLSGNGWALITIFVLFMITLLFINKKVDKK